MEPELVAERLWPGRKAEIEQLGGGITNRNFKISVDGEAYVLRVSGTGTELLGIDRPREHRASLVAAELGIGPEVVAFVEPEGWLVTRFLDGSPIPPEVMRQPDNVARAARALRRLHDGPPVPGRFDAFRVVESYRATAEDHGAPIPAAFARAKPIADAIEARRAGEPERPCHNDLLNANFIDQGGRLRIVDWEYAGMGDRFFDLANFSVNHEFGEAEDEALLEAYLGDVRPADREALRLMRFMSDFREAMWGVVQQGISELPFDFVSYADDHFARLERTAADPRFREALAARVPGGAGG